MAHAQFVCHKLVSVFTVGFTKILVQHDTVDNSATAIYAIHQQECQPGDVVGFHYQAANQKQQNEGHTNATHITSKALCFVFWTEVEETETDEGTVEAEETEEIEKTDEEIAALGYIKAVVTSEEGAKVFESIDPEAIEVETIGAGTEIWILKQEDGWALLYSGSEEDAVRYIRLSDTDAFEEEIVPYEESWYADNSDLEVLLIDETGNPLNNHKAYASVTTVEGEETTITQSIIVDNLAEDEHCEYQWYYSLNGGESWELIPEGTTDTNAYVFSFDMWLRSWKAVVTIKK